MDMVQNASYLSPDVAITALPQSLSPDISLQNANHPLLTSMHQIPTPPVRDLFHIIGASQILISPPAIGWRLSNSESH